jgi:hypothetical protein
MEITYRNPLEWPPEWQRTRIGDRKANAAWKRSMKQYEESVSKELGRMGANEIMFSYNLKPDDRMDCGVAVYFSKVKHEDYGWQDALGLDTPAPTVAQINDAFQKKAMTCHPDRFPDQPEKLELFKKLNEHRQHALDWVRGTEKRAHEFCIPCDRYNEVRLNLAALAGVVRAFRVIERAGVPGVLEHTFTGLKTALPAYAGKEA